MSVTLTLIALFLSLILNFLMVITNGRILPANIFNWFNLFPENVQSLIFQFISNFIGIFFASLSGYCFSQHQENIKHKRDQLNNLNNLRIRLFRWEEEINDSNISCEDVLTAFCNKNGTVIRFTELDLESFYHFDYKSFGRLSEKLINEINLLLFDLRRRNEDLIAVNRSIEYIMSLIKEVDKDDPNSWEIININVKNIIRKLVFLKEYNNLLIKRIKKTASSISLTLKNKKVNEKTINEEINNIDNGIDKNIKAGKAEKILIQKIVTKRLKEEFSI